ncbi:MAG: hypothetical protein H0S80_06985 [Desulfovibrionaceae bacterium]|nr:hypothetical protein [Desulfovibrionaceae bacterium]
MSASRESNLARLRDEAYVIEPGQKFEVDYFRPEDAPGVARLYHAVYGEMFPVDYVYDPDELVRINRGDDLFQVVGRTPKGDVVGLYALFRSAPGRKIMEAGSWIVHPDYRKSTLGTRLALKLHNEPPEHLGLEVIYGQSVCDHIITQKLAQRLKGKFSALEIEAMPPRPGEADAYGRISLMDGFVFLHNRPDTVHLPARYEAQLRRIYDWTGLDRTLQPDAALPANAETVAEVKPMEGAELVQIEVRSVGAGFAEFLADVERDHPGLHTYHLVLPLWLPGSTKAVEAANNAGFFLGGVLPLWFDRDALLMQKVAGTPDFTKPRLHSEESRELLGMIEADWRTQQNTD